MKYQTLKMLLGCWLVIVASTAVAAQPNVIFILVDDLRFDGMGFVNPSLQTPHIDALAAGGMYLPNTVVTTSLCSPSRATLLTGQSARNHGIVDNNNNSEEGLVYFPQMLQSAGYQTAFIGKWHMGRANDNPRAGFDHWVSFKGQGSYFPTDNIPAAMVEQGVRHQLNVDGQAVEQKGYITDELTDYAVQWLDQTKSQQKPFFLYLSHKAVHSNAAPAPRHRGQYAGIDVPMPDPNHDQGAAGAGKPMWVHNQRNSWHGIEFAYHSTEQFSDYVKRYYETLSSVDDSVGRLVQWLQANDQLENTIVVFFSDNGFLFGDHGLIDKRNAYEPSVRVPMVVYGPGHIPAGVTVNSRVRNLDIAPTMTDFAGVEADEKFEGRSLKPLLTGQVDESKWRNGDFVYEYYWEWTFPQTPTTFAITRDEIKYIQYHGLWDLEELYDLKLDPKERENLILDPRYRNQLIDLRQGLFQALLNKRGQSVVPFTEKRAQGLRFRHEGGSKSAPFPPSFVHAPGSEGLFQGFAPPPRIRESSEN